MKLDQEGSDQILAAVRTLVPDGVTVYRRGTGNLIIKYKSARFEWHTASSPAFGHISRRNTRAGALAIGYECTLREVSKFLTGVERRWPGLAWGPVELEVQIDQGEVYANLTDVDGHTITFPTLHTAAKADPDSRVDSAFPIDAASPDSKRAPAGDVDQ
jgi:hypothetical protein